MGASPPTGLYGFILNFTGVLVMVLKYACGLGIILRLYFVTFHKLNLAIFLAFSITK